MIRAGRIPDIRFWTVLLVVLAMLACSGTASGRVSETPARVIMEESPVIVTEESPVIVPATTPESMRSSDVDVPEAVASLTTTAVVVADVSRALKPKVTRSATEKPVVLPNLTLPSQTVTTAHESVLQPDVDRNLASPSNRAAVGRVATARKVDGLQRPAGQANTFAYGERVYISVEFRDVKKGAVLGFRWRSDSGCGGQYETAAQSPMRRGFFAFYVDQAQCPGTYTVDITVDGWTLANTTFIVKKAS